MSELKTDMVQFPFNGDTVPGYLAQPLGDGPFPGVVVLQEWWGLNPHIKQVTERIAVEGFVALALDLYHGEITEEPNEASKLAMALDRERAIAEVSAAAKYLTSLANVFPDKAGVMGFCMGGGLSLSSAAHNGAFGAAVCFYGRPLEAAGTAKISCRYLACTAARTKGYP